MCSQRTRSRCIETRLERVQQLAVLGAGQVGDAIPEVRRLDHVMHLTAHLLLECRDVVHVVGIPQGQRHFAGVTAHIGIILPSSFFAAVS